MRPVARIGQDRRRPGQGGQVLADRARAGKCRGVLLFARRYARRADRIGVYQQPAARGYIGVGCGRVFLASQSRAVARTREQRRVNLVGDEVDPCGGLNLRYSLCEGVNVVKVARVDPFAPAGDLDACVNRAQFGHLSGRQD